MSYSYNASSPNLFSGWGENWWMKNLHFTQCVNKKNCLNWLFYLNISHRYRKLWIWPKLGKNQLILINFNDKKDFRMPFTIKMSIKHFSFSLSLSFSQYLSPSLPVSFFISLSAYHPILLSVYISSRLPLSPYTFVIRRFNFLRGEAREERIPRIPVFIT